MLRVVLVAVVAVGAAAMGPADMAADLKAATLSATTWKAGFNDVWREFANMEHVKGLMGWKPKANATRAALPVASPRMPGGGAPPASFSAEKQWPQCTVIGSIQNQARCGSCWAFGCIESVSDRFCIHTNATFNEELSFEDLTSCGPDDGCEGGEPGDAWSWVQQNGVVTGKCYPYTVPTCAPSEQPCLNFVPTPPCQSGSCVNGNSWQKSLHYTKSTYGINSVQDMMTEIATNGPVEACFSVYADFVHYKSGVYQHQSGGYLGGHCIKITGYGTENGVDYWEVNNSWTTFWGDKGRFKIRRGVDECGIESQVVAGMPAV